VKWLSKKHNSCTYLHANAFKTLQNKITNNQQQFTDIKCCGWLLCFCSTSQFFLEILELGYELLEDIRARVGRMPFLSLNLQRQSTATNVEFHYKPMKHLTNNRRGTQTWNSTVDQRLCCNRNRRQCRFDLCRSDDGALRQCAASIAVFHRYYSTWCAINTSDQLNNLLKVSTLSYACIC